MLKTNKEKIKIAAVLLFFALFVAGAVYLIRTNEQARYQQILKNGTATTATLTAKHEIHKFKSGTTYQFDIMFTANKNTHQIDTVDLGMDIKIPWTTREFDFDLITTSVPVGKTIFDQYNKEEEVNIVYLPNAPKKAVIVLKNK